ncbi:hypothetical protein BJ322DRAFT_1047860 [Thelephora terrestris]|uniref:Uncharacterized protein n=1 Tax=Thelephora terrestris TaxID=56493 RepID=A0A9P6HM29_9AGAM|nr:hypothetical protein BJ322DRAFT_1047860 [Thelephora terrestris]
MDCVDKSSKTVLTDITNIASGAQPFNSIIDYLLPIRSTTSPPSEPLPSFERPATPLGVRALDMEDLEPDQDLASACSRIVSESWEGLSEALQSAKDSLRPPAPGSSTPQAITPPTLPSMVQDRIITPRRKSVRKSPKQSVTTPAPTSVKFRYHGHSKSALADYKYFWNSRCEDWMRYEVELEEASFTAYDGIRKVDLEKDRKSAPASRCPRFRRNGKTEREQQADEAESATAGYRGKYVPDLTAPVYPRTGDLALLHHPAVLETELLFVSFPLHKIHQIFFAFSLDQRFEQCQVGTSDKGSQQDLVEDEPTVEGKTTEDSSFWSEDTLVEDKEFLLYHDDRKSNGRYPEVGLWEVDWATKWEVLTNLFKEHEMEHRGKIEGADGLEGKCFETLGSYRAALADDTVIVGFLNERDDQFTRTGAEPDLFDFEDVVVC